MAEGVLEQVATWRGHVVTSLGAPQLGAGRSPSATGSVTRKKVM